MEFSINYRFVKTFIFYSFVFSMLIILKVAVINDSKHFVHALDVLDARIELSVYE